MLENDNEFFRTSVSCLKNLILPDKMSDSRVIVERIRYMYQNKHKVWVSYGSVSANLQKPHQMEISKVVSLHKNAVETCIFYCQKWNNFNQRCIYFGERGENFDLLCKEKG